MNSKIYISLLLLFSYNHLKAQYDQPYWEFGTSFGFANYHGDMTDGYNQFQDFNPSGGILGKYHANRTVAFRMGAQVLPISGIDAESIRKYQINRNSNFRNNIYELQLAAEIHMMTGREYPLYRDVHPYVLIGIAGFKHNPQTRYNNVWVDLQPLGTEGQGLADYPFRKAYSLYQIALPLAFGVEFHVWNKVYLSLELNYRITLTDYLDDISGYYPDPNTMVDAYGVNSLNYKLSDRRLGGENYPKADGFYPYQFRGDPSNKDGYFFFGFNLSYKFMNQPCNKF